MSACADGDVIRVTAKMSYDAGTAAVQNVYHFVCTFDADQSDSAVHYTLASTLESAYTYLLPFLRSTLKFDTIQTWNETQDRPMIEDAWPTLVDGDETSIDAYAAQAAPLVLFGTNAARSQGRKYLPPVIESAVSDYGTLSSTIQTAITNYAGVLLTQASVSLFNYLNAGNYNKTLSRFAPWLSALISATIRTQRRRVRGVGV
jgi:hypothetical protein